MGVGLGRFIERYVEKEGVLVGRSRRGRERRRWIECGSVVGVGG